MRRKGYARSVVFPAIFGALSLMFLYIGMVIPTGNWAMAAISGLFPAAVIISVGMKEGILCWAGVSLLSFLFLPEKFMALLFTVLFGLYAIVKNLIERLRNIPLECALKLAYFNLAFTVIYFTMKAALFSSLPSALSIVWILYVVANVVFLIYDFGFTKLIGFYLARIYKYVR